MKNSDKSQGYTEIGKEILNEELNINFINNFNKIYENKDNLSEKDWSAIISEYEGATAMIRDLYEKYKEQSPIAKETVGVDNKALFHQTKIDFEHER